MSNIVNFVFREGRPNLDNPKQKFDTVVPLIDVFSYQGVIMFTLPKCFEGFFPENWGPLNSGPNVIL